MILTCPECATSYFVDDSRVPAAGRTVKCSHCGAKWTAVPEITEESKPAPAPAPEAPAADAPAPDNLVAEGPEPEPTAIAPRERKPPPRLAPSTPRPDGKVVVLAVTGGVIVALIAGLLVFRNEVVRAWPASSRAFTSVGLQINENGLVIEQVKTQAAFQGGRPVLSVTGQVRNVHDQPVVAPALRVSLLDPKGKPVAAKIAQPIDGRVPGKAIRHFAIAIVDPPANVSDLEVTFEPQGKSKAPPARAAVLTGPEPIEARPLPSGSPDALPPAHD